MLQAHLIGGKASRYTQLVQPENGSGAPHPLARGTQEDLRVRFGVFYELQLPKPWSADDEHKLYQEALDQKKELDGFITTWQRDYVRLDDMLVMGVRV